MPVRTTAFEGLLEAVPDAMVGVDRAGMIRVLNHQAEELFGYDREELVGQPIETLVPESLRQVHRAHVAVYVTELEPRAMGTGLELCGQRRDGTEFPVDIALSHVNTGDGVLVIAAVRDITDRQKVEQGLHQLAVLLESANAAISGETDAIIGITLEGIITSWNPGAEKMFGYASQEMIGESVLTLSPRNRLDEAADLVAKAREGQAVERYESVRVRRDGTTFPVSLTTSPIFDADGAVIGVCRIFRDLTGQRRDQREIADWRAKAFTWMENLEQSQRLSVMRDFERELKMIDLQQENERLRRLAAQDPRDLGDERQP